MKPLISALLLSLAVRLQAAQELPAPPATPSAKAAVNDARYWVVIRASDRAARSAAADAGMAIEEVAGDMVSGVVSPKDLAELKKRGFTVLKSTKLNDWVEALDFPAEDAIYHNYGELEAELKALAASAPEIASLFSIGKSLGGREIYSIRLNTSASGTTPSGKPGIVFLGTHHAREHLSTEVPFLLAKHLIENRAKPDIAALLATRDVYFIPMVNPDGVEHDIRGGRYRMQRKNMRQNPDGSVGVDLNRNYGFHWGEGGASTNPGSDTYRGPNAFSEPESSAVKSFVEARPNLKILLSYHTFSELILYPWGHTNDPISEPKPLAAYKAMAQTMASMTGYTPEQSSDLYIASGDTTDWAWGAKRIYSFTFELTPKSMWDGGFYPGAAAVASTFQNNIRPALYLIGMADNPESAASAPAEVSTTAAPRNQGGR